MKLNMIHQFIRYVQAFVCVFSIMGLNSCKTQSSSSDSDVKAEHGEFELYIIQKNIANNCCSIVQNTTNFTYCVRETAKQSGPNYLDAIRELARRANTHHKSFVEWVCQQETY